MRFDGADRLHIDAEGSLVLETPAGEIVEQKPVIYQNAGNGRREIAGRFVRHGSRTIDAALGSYDRTRSARDHDPVLVYSSFLGGSSHDEGHSVASDIAGDLYLTGVTYSTLEGDADVIIRKISPDGSTFLYTADVGGSDDDIGNGIAVDANGSAYVGGYTASVDFPTLNPFQDGNAKRSRMLSCCVSTPAARRSSQLA